MSDQTVSDQHVPATASTASVPKTRKLSRTRGALSGILLVILGAWGALIPFIGPWFNFAFTPDKSWTWTAARGWYEVLPGAVTILAGLLLLMGTTRATTLLGAWLGILAGAWFVIGQPLTTELTLGSLGRPTGSTSGLRAAEKLAYFSGLGAIILFLAATAFGRLSVVTLRDVRVAERREAARIEAEELAERERIERERAERERIEREVAERDRLERDRAGRHGDTEDRAGATSGPGGADEAAAAERAAAERAAAERNAANRQAAERHAAGQHTAESQTAETRTAEPQTGGYAQTAPYDQNASAAQRPQDRRYGQDGHYGQDSQYGDTTHTLTPGSAPVPPGYTPPPPRS